MSASSLPAPRLDPPRADAATPSALRSALTGTDESGRFWIPTARAEGFDDADLLLMPDGSYVTHLHDRPSSAGQFHLYGDTLELHGWRGDGTLVMRQLRLDGSRLRASGDDGELEFELLRERALQRRRSR